MNATKVTLVNLTPHAVSLIVGDGGSVTIPPSGIVCRAASTSKDIAAIETGVGLIPVRRIEYGRPEGLPAPAPNTVYIVSALAAQAIRAYHPERDDVVVVADAVRDEAGRVVGAKALAVV